MKLNRYSFGSEAVEVGVTSLILLGLSIAAVTIFGGQIQKVFQGDVSPMIVSAKMGKSSITQSGSPQETARTNIDPNLATNTGLNNIASAVGDKSQSVGMETTGTAGDTGIKGSYMLDAGGYAATHDGNSETTGNLLLDNAIKAKKLAMSLFDQASATIAEAEVFNQIAVNLQSQANYQTQYCTELMTTVTSISDELKRVVEQMMLLNQLAVATSTYTNDMGLLVDSVADINASIEAEVAANMQNYDDINALNADYDLAYNDYLSLKDQYQAAGSWGQDPADTVNVCDGAGGPGCTWTSTSGITQAQLDAAQAQATQIQSSVEGKLEELKQKLDQDLVPSSTRLEEKSKDAFQESGKLLEQAKTTLRDAFHHSRGYFDNCHTVAEYLAKADWIIKNAPWDVENKNYAGNAIDLLTKSNSAYSEAKKLESEAAAAKQAVDNARSLIAVLEGTSATLEQQENLIPDTIINQDEQNSISLIASSTTSQITDLTQLKVILTEAHQDALSYSTQQKSYLDSLLEQAAQAQADAADVISAGNLLKIEATNSMKEAQEAINDIVTPTP